MVEVEKGKRPEITYDFAYGKGRKAEHYEINALNANAARAMVADLLVKAHPEIEGNVECEAWSRLSPKTSLVKIAKKAGNEEEKKTE